MREDNKPRPVALVPPLLMKEINNLCKRRTIKPSHLSKDNVFLSFSFLMLQLLNEDLHFEEPSSWRSEKHRRLVYDRKMNTLQESDYSESDSGLWQRTVRTLRRIKRGVWDWFGTDTTTTTTQDIESTTDEVKSTSEQGTSNT